MSETFKEVVLIIGTLTVALGFLINTADLICKVAIKKAFKSYQKSGGRLNLNEFIDMMIEKEED